MHNKVEVGRHLCTGGQAGRRVDTIIILPSFDSCIESYILCCPSRKQSEEYM